MRLGILIRSIAFFALGMSAVSGLDDAFAAEPAVDFKRDIEPIFKAHCYRCHGDKKRKGGLRLTNKRDAFAPADSGKIAIQPGKTSASPIIQHVTSTDPSKRMPPTGKPLTAQEIQRLRDWIDQGAIWPDDPATKHWAYVKPQKSPRPSVKRADWPINDIDYFVLARMEEQGLSPSPPLDRARWLRRVYLALIGIPPSVEEVDAFLEDASPNAYEKVVDRLLASPQYGERWARPWLDLARYADSNGYQADQLRDSWAYRDWVIKALNQDMRFDQFVIEQLAGDLLPNATIDQKIATGFHRTVTCNVEAGVHPEENRVNQVFDRVNTTGIVFLGTTLECAQCHNHKYDPFTQKEYYQLFAYFNNTPLEVKQTGGVTYDFVGPKMLLPLPPEQRARRQELETRLQLLKQQKAEQAAADKKKMIEWERDVLAALKNPPRWQVLNVDHFESTGGEQFQILDDQSVLIGGSVPGTSVYTIWSETRLSGITGFKVETLTHESLPGKGPGRGDDERTNFILSEFSVEIEQNGKTTEVELHGAEADFSQRGWEVHKAIDGDRTTGWAIAPQFHKPHYATFRTKQPIGKGEPIKLKFSLDQNYGRGRTIGRVRLSALVGDPAVADVPQSVKAILLKKTRTSAEQKQLAAYFTKANPRSQQIDAEIQEVQRELNQLQPPSTLIMVEMEKPRVTHVLQRGDYLKKGERVEPGTPAALHPLDPALPRNRLGLAKWLVDRDNPLLARVTVNRWWDEIFGRPIVSTPEDFGSQAEPPTHPKLLDWLAVEFMDHGWSPKHIHKLMVLSATFRQSSRTTPELWERDPENKWYARGPRFRMSAEMIRDSALKASGLLCTKMGGKPIMPFQPPGIWRTVGRNAPKWVEATNEDRFRRGIYVVWRRAAPYPSFVNFDGPDRAACVVKRPRTNTPLQALTLLNDMAYVEMALSLAQHMLVDRPNASVKDKLIYGFRRCLSRRPNDKELAILARLLQTSLENYRRDPKAAADLVSSSKGFKPAHNIDPVQLAAWFCVANALLNLDETITRG
ncbi:MAG: hypothetical protein KatS3mg105_0781 [Gemmatales bacterium]|nr:MAG: hypothetical protein KatS3mg105_0781 [Gemmatales bacterium]